MSEPIVLGRPEAATCEDVLRGGAIEVRSRHGLRPTDALLVEALPDASPGRFLAGHDPEAVVAIAASRLWGAAGDATWWHLDAYVTARATLAIDRAGARVQVTCSPDLPGVAVPGEPAGAPAGRAPGALPEVGPFDLVALPFPRGQEAILGRELIEEAHAALASGGWLLAATDDAKGTWLKRVLREVFGRNQSTAVRRRHGIVVRARRTRERAEVRDHRHPILATLRGHALRLDARPGVFGYARIDDGTRALAERIEVGEADVVLDLGCGYGPLALAAAACAPRGRVVAVDSNARAVRLAERNAAANGLANVRVLLRADPVDLGEPTFDLVLANPPYYSDYRIARAFVGAARAALRPGGRIGLVAKAAGEHAALLEDGGFEDVTVSPTERGHGVVMARRCAAGG